MTNPAHPFNAVNRGVYIADNLPFLRSLNNESVDLVCIDPPFAKNETFGKKNDQARDPLKPPPHPRRKGNRTPPAGKLGHPQRKRRRQGRHQLARNPIQGFLVLGSGHSRRLA